SQPVITHYFLQRVHAPPTLPSFPTRRSSDLPQVVVDAVVERQKHVIVLALQEVENVPGVDSPFRARGDVEQGPECRALERGNLRSEEHTSELQSPYELVCRLLLEKKKIDRGI